VNVLYYPKRRDKPMTTSPGKSFVLEYTYNGWKPGINEQIINMAANASGIRDTARVLKVCQSRKSATL